jgi:glutamyl-tRNA reductase
VSPLTKALQKRFEEVSRSELQRLRKKTSGLEPEARAAIDAFTVEVMQAIAARATEPLHGPEDARLATVLARLFGVNERVGSVGTHSSPQN